MSSYRRLLEKEPVEASAPCRLDMGGTLDLSTFYLPLRHLKPCTFNAAIDLRTRVRLLPYLDGRIKITSRGFDPVEVDSREAPFSSPVGLMLAVASFFNADGVHIEIDSSSPPRSALGGSSVAAVAIAWALSKVLAIEGAAMPDPGRIAAWTHAIEQSVAGVPCGLQDHLAAVYGGINGWRWAGGALGELGYERRELIDENGYHEFNRRILVAYCGVPHVSKDINGTWVRDFLAGRYRETWRRIIGYARDFIEALVRGDYSAAVSAMNSETDLRVLMTVDVLGKMGRRLVTAARGQGCGARFTGAGGGGCIWAIGEPDRIISLRPEWQSILDDRPEAALLNVSVDGNGIL